MRICVFIYTLVRCKFQSYLSYFMMKLLERATSISSSRMLSGMKDA